MRRILLITAATAGVAICLAGIVSVAARGGGDSSGTFLLGDVAEHIFGFGGHGGGGQCRVLGLAENAVSATLNISVAQLESEMQSGQSVQQVAQAHGMGADAFRAALTQTAGHQAAQAVAAGTMTQARAAELSQRLKDNLGFVLNYQLDPGKPLPCRGYRGSGGPADHDQAPPQSPGL